MTEEKPKKKRFEGLIHFKEALRQTIVCLQAAMEDRFASTLQSNLIKQLDQNPEQAFHLLFGIKQAVGEINQASDLKSSHLLARIYQQQSEDLRQEICCPAQDLKHINMWINPSDPLMASYFFRLVSLACQGHPQFDLKDSLSWGSVMRSQEVSDVKSTLAFVESCSNQYGFTWDRQTIVQEFVQSLAPILQTFSSVHLHADGSYISFVVEGMPKADLRNQFCSWVQKLSESGAHSLAINIPEEPSLPTQFAVLMPIRLQNKSVNIPYLKGFILLHQICRKKEAEKPKLAG